jgi:hypothetical protein
MSACLFSFIVCELATQQCTSKHRSSLYVGVYVGTAVPAVAALFTCFSSFLREEYGSSSTKTTKWKGWIDYQHQKTAPEKEAGTVVAAASLRSP